MVLDQSKGQQMKRVIPKLYHVLSSEEHCYVIAPSKRMAESFVEESEGLHKGEAYAILKVRCLDEYIDIEDKELTTYVDAPELLRIMQSYVSETSKHTPVDIKFLQTLNHLKRKVKRLSR